MLIAQEKERSNIAEYILYMWQIEDIIRSNEFDLEQIQDLVINKFEVSEELRSEMKLWYQNLIEQMLKQGLSEKGHLRSNLSYLEELNNLHNSLLTTVQDQEYQQQYLKSRQNIENFIKKMGDTAGNEIYSCFTALYALFLLKLNKSDVSTETKEAMRTFSDLLALLADRYHKIQKGALTLSKEKSN
ncbi:MAG: DUF4924 family protein [Flavobacteriales bacterium]|nr:DUF4924 family protein [Flavobacteriales bacterium]